MDTTALLASALHAPLGAILLCCLPFPCRKKTKVHKQLEFIDQHGNNTYIDM